jgi:hypothetical protein
MTYHTVSITHNYEGRETESASALGGLDHAVNGNHFVFQLQVAGLHPVYIEF